jgi:acetyltransferase-like isoleucine patch superfamily enzyme
MKVPPAVRSLPGARALAVARHRRRAKSLLTMGRESYGEPRVVAYPGETTRAIVGDFVSIADEVLFLVGGIHPVERVSTFLFRARLGLPGAYQDGIPATKGDIVVGNDVWIGFGATVLSGITIGNGAVVAATATVTKDVRPYAIVAGNPAREIRRRFSDEEVERLEQLAWWNWPLELIVERIPLLNGDDVEAFLRESEEASTTRTGPTGASVGG